MKSTFLKIAKTALFRKSCVRLCCIESSNWSKEVDLHSDEHCWLIKSCMAAVFMFVTKIS